MLIFILQHLRQHHAYKLREWKTTQQKISECSEINNKCLFHADGTTQQEISEGNEYNNEMFLC